MEERSGRSAAFVILTVACAVVSAGGEELSQSLEASYKLYMTNVYWLIICRIIVPLLFGVLIYIKHSAGERTTAKKRAIVNGAALLAIIIYMLIADKAYPLTIILIERPLSMVCGAMFAAGVIGSLIKLKSQK